MTGEFESHFVPVQGITLHVKAAGPKDGPLLVFLHGFPEFWMGWRNQLEHFSQRGFRVLVPDQRGYNLSDKPESIQDYRLDKLIGDVTGLIDWAGRKAAFIVGHDWGAAVAWGLAIQHPERVQKLAILNVPHPMVMKKNLATNPRQMLRSWYIFFFQIPKLAEWQLSQKAAQGIYDNLRKTRAFSDEELVRYREAWQKPGALRSMIHWYRALRYPVKLRNRGRVSVPTLIIWGVHDRFLSREMAAQSTQFCDQARLELIEDATHWVQHEKPERVNELIEGFLSES